MTDFTSDQLLSPSLSTSQTGKVSCRSKTRLCWAVYLLTFCLFVEVSLQLFYRVTIGTYLYVREKPPIYASDLFSGWTNRPNFSYRHVTPEFATEIHTNSGGFRVSPTRQEFGKGKPDNTFRILLLGPSFAFGWGVNYEETFAAQLQRILADRHFAKGSRIEVLNHGVPGLPAANELAWLKHVGNDYAPNLVIHFVYGSLEARSKPKTDIVVRDGVLVLTELTTKEMIVAYAKNLATVFYGGVVFGKLHALASSHTSSGRIEGAGRDLRNSAGFNVQDPVVGDSLIFYQRLKDAVSSAGADLLVVYFPLSYVVYPEDRARWAILGVRNIEEQIDYNGAFAAHLTALGIKTLDLTDIFRQSSTTEKRRLYYWLDLHWTELGNSVAARSVAGYLTRQCHGCDKETN